MLYCPKIIKNNTNQQELKDYLTENGLINIKTTSWNSRSINGSRGELSGSVTNNKGVVIHLVMSYVKNDGS